MAEQINVDNHKLMFHPERVFEWKKKGDCYPVYVEIGPTNACNHKCVFCALDFLKNEADFIDTEIMLSALKDMADNGVKSIMFAGEGEPLLHKDIGLFTKMAKQYGMDISITTNGVLFSEEKLEQCLPNLSWIRFSVDSGSPENYGLVHGTNNEDFNKLITNLRKAVEFKEKNNLKTTIGVQFLVIPQNINQATKLAETLKEIGVDNLQIKPYSHHPKSNNNLVVNQEEYTQLGEQLKKFNSDKFKILFRESTAKRIIQGITYPRCYGLPFFTLIDAKGNVIPCNLFYNNPKLTYGNLYENSFSEIWQSDKRKQILNEIYQEGSANCRKGCRLDTINRYLDRIANPQLHDNFI